MLAHATCRETALTPRRFSVVFEIWTRGPWATAVVASRSRCSNRMRALSQKTSAVQKTFLKN